MVSLADMQAEIDAMTREELASALLAARVAKARAKGYVVRDAEENPQDK
ncbi:MAG: hypothetical protein LUG57_02485 [Oscillospiraceae bacterium]|nr:hypothetical protein [Oscillospiraceae bacterium]